MGIGDFFRKFENEMSSSACYAWLKFFNAHGFIHSHQSGGTQYFIHSADVKPGERIVVAFNHRESKISGYIINTYDQPIRQSEVYRLEKSKQPEMYMNAFIYNIFKDLKI